MFVKKDPDRKYIYIYIYIYRERERERERETSQLFCCANKMTGSYIKYNTGLKVINRAIIFGTLDFSGY